MLKILLGLLIMINAGLFAYQQGYLDILSPSNREPTRLTQQLNADKLKLISSALIKGAEAKLDADAAALAAPPEPENDLTTAAQLSTVVACIEVGNFDAAEAQKFETRLAGLALEDRLTRRAISENVRHMVYIPPSGGREAADKKANELRQLGVQDFFVIQDASPLQWGISLGIFKSEDAARSQLAALNQKGVRSARVGAHTATATKVAFRLRGLDLAEKNTLTKIKEAFPKQELSECNLAAG